MKKTFILILIVTIAIGSTAALVHYTRMDTFSFAWALNFMLMLFILPFSDTLKSPFTSSYYNEKGWERKGKIYKNLGINFFRKLLVLIGWEKLLRKSNPVEKNTQTLTNLHYQTKKSEFNHLIILFIVLGFNFFVAFKYGILKSLWLLLLNIILHLYPIMLQRYNRPRIERAINLSKRR
jgi:amino acid permease